MTGDSGSQPISRGERAARLALGMPAHHPQAQPSRVAEASDLVRGAVAARRVHRHRRRDAAQQPRSRAPRRGATR